MNRRKKSLYRTLGRFEARRSVNTESTRRRKQNKRERYYFTTIRQQECTRDVFSAHASASTTTMILLLLLQLELLLSRIINFQNCHILFPYLNLNEAHSRTHKIATATLRQSIDSLTLRAVYIFSLTSLWMHQPS